LLESEKYIGMAQRFLEARVKKFPKVGLAWSRLGTFYATRPNKRDKAEAALRKAVALQPNIKGNWERLADFLVEKKEWHAAEEVYRDALRARPRQYEFWKGLGWVMEQQDKPTEAEDSYRRAIEICPLAHEVVDALAHLFVVQGKWPETLALISTLLNQALESGEAVELSTELAIKACAAGFPHEIVRLLEISQGREALEPLEIGIRLFTGEQVNAPKEIFEVANDIAQKIHAASKREVYKVN
jgi:cytochrome c-type biogenesis protein CcmH/NrfG